MTTLAQMTVEHGGGTFEVGTWLPFSPDHGYAVGIGGIRSQVRVGVDGDIVESLGRRVAQEWMTAFVGTWIDGDNLHIDGVEYIVDRAFAIERGRECHQKAIWDFATGQEVWLD